MHKLKFLHKKCIIKCDSKKKKKNLKMVEEKGCQICKYESF